MATDGEASDGELIRAAQRGGDGGFAAFEILVARHRERVYRLALTLTKSESDAEEVVQEVFLNLFRSLAGFRAESKPSTWIYRIATNSALMHLRGKRRKPLLSIEDNDPPLPERAIWPAGVWSRAPDDAYLDGELREKIHEAIDRLPEKYRIVLLLQDVEGMSSAEVAETVGATIPTVKARLHRSRLFVRRELRRYFDPG